MGSSDNQLARNFFAVGQIWQVGINYLTWYQAWSVRQCFCGKLARGRNGFRAHSPTCDVDLMDNHPRKLLALRMTETPSHRQRWPWLTVIAFGALWGLIIRQFSPHWSIFPQYNYGWGVPFLSLYLLGERWLTRPATATPRSNFKPILLTVVAALILMPARLIQEANTTWRLTSWAMALSAISITLSAIYLAGGRSWLRHFCFPVGFFLVAVPWPTGLEHAVVQNLTQLNVGATVEALTLWGIPAMQQGNVIEVSTGLVGIDDACSGIRSLQATLMIALFLGEWYRFKPGRRIGLMVAAVTLAFVFNVARTFLLVSVAAREGIGAVARWHDPAGVTILVACFSTLWGLAFLLRPKLAPSARGPGISGRPLPKIFLAALTGWVVLTEAGTELWYRAHETQALSSREWTIRWPTGKGRFQFEPISKEVHEIMNFDEGKAARWVEEGHGWQAFYFRWQPARSLAQRVNVQAAKGHRPEICLRATGMTMREDFGIRWIKVGQMKFPFHRYQFEDRGAVYYVFYSVWEDGIREQSAANMRENNRARLAAAWAGTRGLGQRILEVVVSGMQNEPQAEAALENQLQGLIQE